jgi:hypothetical protein
MNMERDPQGEWVRLPGFAESTAAGGQAPASDGTASAGQTGSARSVGIRHVRRMSNWTAAALVVGAGATTLALAHHAFPVAAPAAGAASATSTGVGGTAAAQGANGPQVSHTVATTSASGVTTTTVTKVVNGKTVVSHVKHVPAYIDN